MTKPDTAVSREAMLREALGDLVSWFDGGPHAYGPWIILAGEYGADDAVEAARAALSSTEATPAQETSGVARRWPDIGSDPMKGKRPDDRYEASIAAVRAAYVRQQGHVPDQTALVWRWHLGAVLEMATRLKGFLDREDHTPKPSTTATSSVTEEVERRLMRIVNDMRRAGQNVWADRLQDALEADHEG